MINPKTKERRSDTERYWLGLRKEIKNREFGTTPTEKEKFDLRLMASDLGIVLRGALTPKAVARFFCGLYWRLFIVRLSLKWIDQFNVGDEVRYKGYIYHLTQGVRAPYWDMSLGTIHVKNIHEKDLRKVRSFENLLSSFRSGYSFYMRSWFDIWMYDGIRPWMLECNIWPNKWRKADGKGTAE